METEKYQQGSKSCHQYSAHTMQIRTQAVYLLLTYIGVMGLALRGAESTEKFPNYYGELLVGAGTILVLAAIVLAMLNYHYSSAHNAIRGALCDLEGNQGPWTAHRNLRQRQWSRSSAWYGPFVLIGVIGGFSVYYGARLGL